MRFISLPKGGREELIAGAGWWRNVEGSCPL